MHRGLWLSPLIFSVIFGCSDGEVLTFNTFAVAPPVTEVVCPDVEPVSPWAEEDLAITEGLSGIWGPSNDDLWAVGGRGTILRRQNAVWVAQVQNITTADLLAIDGTSAQDIWVVGRAGTVLRFDGTTWSQIRSSAQADLVDVHVVGSDVWVAGNEGAFRFDGSMISRVPGAPTEPVNGIWASGESDVIFVTDTTFHRYDGSQFVATTIEGAGRLAAVWGTGAGRAWTIGHGAAQEPGLGVLEGGQWQFQAAPPRGVFFTVWTRTGQDVLVGASNSSIFRFENGAWCTEHEGGIGAINQFFAPAADAPLWVVGAVRSGSDTQPLMMRRPQR